MPDMKTAMSKVLNEWEKDAQETGQEPKKAHRVDANGKPVFSVTNNVTRVTFDYVKNNPGLVCKDICAQLMKQGFKENSVTSLLTQFAKQGAMRRDEHGRYYTKIAEYKTLKQSKYFKAEGLRKSKIVTSPRTSTGIAALKPEPSLPKEKVTGVISSAWDAETVINNIGLKQAHALYQELGKYFGGYV